MSIIVDFPSNQSESQHHHRCVHFSNLLEYQHINCISSNDNKHDLWYSKSELKDMQTSWARSISRIASKRMTLLEYAKMHVHDTTSFLGLEGFLTRDTFREISLRRRSLYDAVLSEQTRQTSSDVYDPDAMARISEVVTVLARNKARLIGKIHSD